MVTIGVDPHKQTHTAAAVDELGSEVAHRTVPARPAGNGQLLEWARAWMASGCGRSRMSATSPGSLERFLIDRGETVVRLAPQLMAGARRGVRTRGKSDPIDATAIARAALREGIETLPTARLAGPEREIRMLALYRERLLDMRTRLSNELRWQLHDLWPDWEIPAKALAHPGWQTKVATRLARAEQTTQVLIARDMIRRIRELCRATKTFTTRSPRWSNRSRRSYLPNPGSGSSWPRSSSARSPGSTGSPQTPSSPASPAAPQSPPPADDQTATGWTPAATAASTAPSTCSRSSASLNDPRTALYFAKQRANGKTKREAIRNLKRHLARRVYHLLRDPTQVPTTICLT